MSRTSSVNRNVFIAASVVLFHAAALWALQTGLFRRAAEIIVPAEILSEFIEPPAPKVVPVPPAPIPTVKPAPIPVPRTPAPLPMPPSEPAPADNAPVAVAMPPATTTPGTVPAMVATPPSAASAAPAAPPRVEPPSSVAQYLQNPKPPYPAISKRLGEQGKVVVRVLIGVDGAAQKAEIRQSSGFDRLDQAALTTVLGWRYVPGKRGGVPEAMWFDVPIHFILE